MRSQPSIRVLPAVTAVCSIEWCFPLHFDEVPVRHASTFFSILLGLAAIACSDPPSTVTNQQGIEGDGDDRGDGDHSGDGDDRKGDGDSDDGDGDGDGDSTPDRSSCEGLIAKAQPIPPDILIVQDRSSSMLPTFNMTFVDRWTPSTGALKSATKPLENDVKFGLLLFPDSKSNGCTVPNKPEVPMSLATSGKIGQALDANPPSPGLPPGFTPTAAALKAALQVFNSRPNDVDSILAPGYVLLVTDGEPSCGGGPGEDATSTQGAIDMTSAAIDALLKADIKTFVVGYDVTTASATMDAFAKRGGTNKHIAVTSGKELEDALRQVAGALTPCSFRLPGNPQDPSAVTVTIDGMLVTADPAHGWSLDGPVVKLNGDTCKNVQDGEVHPVDISAPCAALL